MNVKSFSIVHNAIMFFASLYMVIETLRQVPPAAKPLAVAAVHNVSCLPLLAHPKQTAGLVHLQAAENIGWGQSHGGSMWGNIAEAPGKPFSRSGHRLATVLYIHYLSKVSISHPILPLAFSI